MGNSESNPVRNMDKRTARRTYHEEYSRAIELYRSSGAVVAQHAARAKALAEAEEDGDERAAEKEREGEQTGSEVQVFVRKRPIHKEELSALEFDVITCPDGGGRKLVAVHDARMHSDMRHMLMHHNEFQFDRVFSEHEGNAAVYDTVAAPLVAEAAGGGYATCVMYGQTGSGKTYTMSSIYERAAVDLFSRLSAASSGSGGGNSSPLSQSRGRGRRKDRRRPSSFQVSVSFFELAGEVCSDLLNGFERAQLLTGADGSVHAFPLVEVAVANPAELLAMVQHGFAVRSTSATGVHNASSRSHAVLRIYNHFLAEGGEGGGEDGDSAGDDAGDDERCGDGSGDAGDDAKKSAAEGSKQSAAAAAAAAAAEFEEEGVLTLVDLAGSEHRIDSMHHTAQRRKEGAEINSSLMALKTVVHARAKAMKHKRSGHGGEDTEYLYRLSKLTMALKNSFTRPGAKTCVIATVSPASKDTEHSLNTLRHACVMDGRRLAASQQHDKQQQAQASEQVGGVVRTVSVGEVNVAQHSKRARAGQGPSDELTSSNGNAWGGAPDPWNQLTGRKLQLAKAKKHRLNERRALEAMDAGCRSVLKEARRVGASRGGGAAYSRQEWRLRRRPFGAAAPVEEAVVDKVTLYKEGVGVDDDDDAGDDAGDDDGHDTGDAGAGEGGVVWNGGGLDASFGGAPEWLKHEPVTAGEAMQGRDFSVPTSSESSSPWDQDATASSPFGSGGGGGGLDASAVEALAAVLKSVAAKEDRAERVKANRQRKIDQEQRLRREKLEKKQSQQQQRRVSLAPDPASALHAPPSSDPPPVPAGDGHPDGGDGRAVVWADGHAEVNPPASPINDTEERQRMEYLGVYEEHKRQRERQQQQQEHEQQQEPRQEWQQRERLLQQEEEGQTQQGGDMNSWGDEECQGELRVDDADGQAYSRQEFLEEYGNLHKWGVSCVARRQAPVPTTGDHSLKVFDTAEQQPSSSTSGGGGLDASAVEALATALKSVAAKEDRAERVKANRQRKIDEEQRLRREKLEKKQSRRTYMDTSSSSSSSMHTSEGTLPSMEAVSGGAGGGGGGEEGGGLQYMQHGHQHAQQIQHHHQYHGPQSPQQPPACEDRYS